MSESESLDSTTGDRRRQQIYRAVLACVAEVGAEKTSMRMVADRAGFSTGMLAYYFPSKKAMIDAAFRDAANKYMQRFRARLDSGKLVNLDEFVDQYLSHENVSANFVLRMLQASLHNPDLLSVHEEMMAGGHEMLERSVRHGMETGEYRDDVDPWLITAVFHSVMLWWGSELSGKAISRETALQVGKLALQLMKRPQPADSGSPPARLAEGIGEAASVPEVVQAYLLTDPLLRDEPAAMLAEAFGKLYSLAVEASAPRTGPSTSNGHEPDL